MSAKFRFDHLKIEKSEYNKLIRWSLSLYEIGALAFGKGNHITKVVRIPNALSSRDHFIWNWPERRRAIRQAEMEGLELVCESHSHPRSQRGGHLPHPSLSDLKYFKRLSPHLIIFPTEPGIRCWVLRQSIRDTIESELEIEVIQ